MNKQYDKVSINDLVNKNGAGIAMCAVTLLLFAFNIISYFTSMLAQMILVDYIDVTERGFTSFLKFFGVSSADAIIAARHFFSSSALFEMLNMVIAVFTTLIPTIIFSKFVKLSSDDVFPIKGKTVKGFFCIFCTIQLLTQFSGMISTLIYDWFFPDSNVSPTGFFDYSGIEFDIYTFIIEIISVCIFVPLIEEFIFRGVIFGYLKKFGTMFAVIGSAVIFGIAHSNPSQSVYALVFGIISAFLVAVTGNIKTSVIFHALNNFASLVTQYLTSYTTELISTTISCTWNIIVCFLGIFGIFLLAKKNGLVEQFRDSCQSEVPERREYAGMKQIMVFPLIVFAIIYIIQVITAAV